MFRFRTLCNVLKRNTGYQLTQVRGSRSRNNRRDERPDDARKIQLWNKEYRKEKEAAKSAQTIVKQNFFFTNEKNLEFSKCMIAYNRVMGAFYFVTVKETEAQFQDLYQKQGRKNFNSVRSIGAHSKVNYDVDPADAAKIKLITNNQKLERIFYIDPSEETNMKGFLQMSSEMLNEGGQIHMILVESDFQRLQVVELAKAVKIYLKEETEFFEDYCKGFTLTRVNAREAMIYKLELDTSRKTSEIQECNNADLVAEPMSSLADNHNAVESGCSSEVNPSVGQWNLMYLACGTELKFLSQHVQLHYHESGRSSEVDPSVDQWNMVYLNMINARPNEQAVGCLAGGRLPHFMDRPTITFGADVTHPQVGEDSSPWIAAACASLEENQLPPVTVLPGAVVGTNIFRPSEFDLYLSSRAGIQGTGGLTHTHAEDKFNADGLQILTPSCYMSTSSDSIGGMPCASIVRRAYYAHPAAVIPMVSIQQ